MKTMQDVQSRLKLELNIWFKKQCQNSFADFYLWILPTTNEHDGHFLILKDKPANVDMQLVCKVDKSKTIDQNYNILRGVLFKLPILSQ